MAKKKKLTPEQIREQQEREIYLSCLFIDCDQQNRPVPDDVSFEDFFAASVMDAACAY